MRPQTLLNFQVTNKHLYCTGTFYNKLLLGFRVEVTIISPTVGLRELKAAPSHLTGPLVNGVMIAEVRKPLNFSLLGLLNIYCLLEINYLQIDLIKYSN